MWNTEYKGISISFEDKIVRLKVDDILMKYLGQPGNDAVVLSEYILGTYFDMFHKKLEISLHSLAVEIIIHAYIDRFCNYVHENPCFPINEIDLWLKQLCASIGQRTEVIDCGERQVDRNRFVFDGLEKFHGLIYKMIGDLA